MQIQKPITASPLVFKINIQLFESYFQSSFIPNIQAFPYSSWINVIAKYFLAWLQYIPLHFLTWLTLISKCQFVRLYILSFGIFYEIVTLYWKPNRKKDIQLIQLFFGFLPGKKDFEQKFLVISMLDLENEKLQGKECNWFIPYWHNQEK